MKELIEALQIFSKYKQERWPLHCEHDTLYVVGYERGTIPFSDAKRLYKLGFFWCEDIEGWASYRFGSA